MGGQSIWNPTRRNWLLWTSKNTVKISNCRPWVQKIWKCLSIIFHFPFWPWRPQQGCKSCNTKGWMNFRKTAFDPPPSFSENYIADFFSKALFKVLYEKPSSKPCIKVQNLIYNFLDWKQPPLFKLFLKSSVLVPPPVPKNHKGILSSLPSS